MRLKLTQSKLIELKDKSTFIFRDVNITFRVIDKIDKINYRRIVQHYQQYALIHIYEIFSTVSK